MKKYSLIIILFILSTNLVAQSYHDAIKLKKYTIKVGDDYFINWKKIDSVWSILAPYYDLDGIKVKKSIINDSISKNPFFLRMNGGPEQSENNKEITPKISLFSPSSIGGLNVTNIADGLAKFLVERAKQELSIAFFDKFRKELDELEELKILFPKTHLLLSSIGDEIYNFSGYTNMLREAFQEDLKTIIPNLRTLLNSDVIKKYFVINPTIKVILNNALLIAEDLQNGKYSGDVLTSLKNENLNDKTIRNFSPSIQLLDLISQSLKSKQKERYWISSDSLKLLMDDTTLKIYLGLIYQQSADIKFESKNGKISPLQESLRKIGEKGEVYTKNKEYLKTYLKTLVAKAERVDRSLKTIKDINSKEDQKSKYAEHYEFYNASIDLFEHSLSVRSIPIIDSLMYFDVSGFNKYFNIARIAGDLYLDVREKNYFSAILNLNIVLEKSILGYEDELNKTLKELEALTKKISKKDSDVKKIVKEIDDLLEKQGAYRGKESIFKDLEKHIETLKKAIDTGDIKVVVEDLEKINGFFKEKKDSIPSGLMKRYKEILPKIIKYGNMVASIAKAESSDEVKKIIEAIVLPAGSASIKKKSAFNVSLNAYLGGYYGKETLDDPGFLAEKQTTYGFYTPIGVAASWRFNKYGSITLFVSVIDLGAISSFRVQDESTVSMESMVVESKVEKLPEITFENILAPGLHLIYGLPGVPISVGGGYQRGPQLRKINVVTTTLDNGEITDTVQNEIKSSAWRWNIFIAVDIPLFNFYTKPR